MASEILVIEDDIDCRETLVMLLQCFGFNVAAAENGLEGLKQIQAHGMPCFIFLDMTMPVMSGRQFLDAFHRDYPDLMSTVPILMISAMGEFVDLGPHHCQKMAKPLDIDRVLDIVNRHCSQHRAQ